MSESRRPKEFTPADTLRRAADRMRQGGRPATAILLDNAAWIADGGELGEYDWAPARLDGRTDDIAVRESKTPCGS